MCLCAIQICTFLIFLRYIEFVRNTQPVRSLNGFSSNVNVCGVSMYEGDRMCDKRYKKRLRDWSGIIVHHPVLGGLDAQPNLSAFEQTTRT